MSDEDLIELERIGEMNPEPRLAGEGKKMLKSGLSEVDSAPSFKT